MVYYMKIYNSNNCKVTCLMTCLLLYWPKIHRIFVSFSFFWQWVSLFLVSSINIINATYDKKGKKREKPRQKSVYCQSLQSARYRSGCNPWVMPVLPISTVPSVGTPLGRYWLNTGAVLFFSAGKQPTFVYCQASAQHWISTGAVPPFNVSKQPTFE